MDPTQSLIGSTISHYRIVDKLGEGAMGAVYLAEDSDLKREVALKVLPVDLATDPERLARFRREAEAVAALNHPSIVTIHSVEEAAGLHFFTMERVAGRSLDRLIARKGLQLGTLLELARQLAEALAVAHAKGITHRDLKPANVMVDDSGHLKILDFGLAKLRPPAAEGDASQLATASLTADGRILGTAAYMSPEQALGKPADHRSDIFSLGTMLYEMAAGSRPFAGDGALEVMSSIVKDDPRPVTEIRAGLPRFLWRIIKRCLEKDPLRRYQSAIDVRNDVLEIEEELASGALAGQGLPSQPGRLAWRRLLPWALLPLVAVAAWMLRPGSPPPPVVRFRVDLPAGERLASVNRQGFDLSPDGGRLAMVSAGWDAERRARRGPRILVRALAREQLAPVRGSEGALDLVFSPDGEWIAFSTLEPPVGLKKIAVDGGEALTLCACAAHHGLAWSPDGTILFAEERGGLRQVSAAGGEPRVVTELDEEAGELSHRLPHVLPGGRVVLYTALRHELGAHDWSNGRIWAQPLAGGERKLLVEGASDGRYLASGHLVFAREGTLFAAPFDARRLELTGPEVPVLEGVGHAIHTHNAFLETGRALYSVAATGLLAYAAGSVFPEAVSQPVWVDRQGREEPLAVEPRAYVMARLSPDDRQALVTRNYPPYDVRLLDLERGTFRRQTFEGVVSFVAWGPGEDRFTLVSHARGRQRLLSKRIDGGPGGLEELSERNLTSGQAAGWAPGSGRLVFVDRSESGFDILSLEAGGRIEPVLDSRFSEKYPALSPDGRWLVYTSDESGRTEVFVRPFPEPGRAVQVSTGGGESPGWSRDGSEIFFRPLEVPGRLVAVGVEIEGDRLRIGEVVELFELTGYGGSSPLRSWDVARDGRFLFFKTIGSVEAEVLERLAPERLQLVQNWLAELR